MAVNSSGSGWSISRLVDPRERSLCTCAAVGCAGWWAGCAASKRPLPAPSRPADPSREKSADCRRRASRPTCARAQ
eukprot:1232360-Rhodomonas_salina.2